MAKSKPKKVVAEAAKAKAPKPKPKAAAVKAKPTTAKAAKPKKAAPKAAGTAKPAKAKATKPKTPRKPTRAKRAVAEMTLITPVITNPANNSNHAAGQNLSITATTNDTAVRYRIVVTDVTNPPPFPPPTNVDLAAPGVSPFNGTIPGATFAANKTYNITLIVYPGDGNGIPSQIQIKT